MLVALDTSTTLTGLACYNASGLVAECAWQSGRNHTAQVLPQLNQLLRYSGHSPADVAVVAVALGPGSWSGLRVGLSLAKGIALAGGLPLLGIGTLDALAFQYQHPHLPVYPLIKLGRTRYATARFAPTPDWQRVGDYRNSTLPELCAELAASSDAGMVLCGDIDTAAEEEIVTALGERALLPPLVARLRRPGFLAALAWARYTAGEQDNLHQLEPFYLGAAVQSPAAS